MYFFNKQSLSNLLQRFYSFMLDMFGMPVLTETNFYLSKTDIAFGDLTN